MTKHWKSNAIVFEVNARVWLAELAAGAGRRISLAEIPEEELDRVANLGVDFLWLMGVWQTGSVGKRIAAEHPDLQTEYRQALPDFTPADVIGSPFAVQAYEVAAELGGREALKVLRERLLARDIGLILDFVPNHTARDHRWVLEYPEYYMRAAAEIPGETFAIQYRGEAVHVFFGRDPYFPPWTDTAQLDLRHPGLRAAMVETLRSISEISDGVRCDMAMLALSDVMERTWSSRLGAAWHDAPVKEYWDEVIREVREDCEEFFFLAEAYWGMEHRLQELGFAATYDKEFYDRIIHGDSDRIVQHLWADISYQNKSLRFLENHDEKRVAGIFDSSKHQAAAVIALTIPGSVLLHEGQMEGAQVRLPVQLRRRPQEILDEELKEFYSRFLTWLTDTGLRGGEWAQCRREPAWAGDEGFLHIVAHEWKVNARRFLVVVNFSDAERHARVIWNLCNGDKVKIMDRADANEYERSPREMAEEGLYVILRPWGYHLLEAGAGGD
ncbi:MAG: alpha-amylase family glycosyl hydrolase [Candidatus Lernaella stagnicola]|nr:alpha-amylase family glycosyl hydrolase [Candidatus Lernaella stagnicola]